MPLYEYECQACGEHVEKIQRVDDAPLMECPSCGGALRRLLGVPALQFKGSGWYVTDYGKGNGRGDRPSASGGTGASSGGGTGEGTKSSTSAGKSGTDSSE